MGKKTGLRTEGVSVVHCVPSVCDVRPTQSPDIQGKSEERTEDLHKFERFTVRKENQIR